ncbi:MULTISPECIES: prephenate dehydrogenase/arogenate dehydrogenase family protein [Halococcus]|uniref:Prephenate dehydrogenase n=1 Tax=Halococcus salifodinae DSM 8989 TaxID=1227456 RepID=M0N753_9EURY|nr:MULTISPECIES: prephenate dehydrogenase/arogenate dehydrogenase family protein [Halococcus]EMA53388.1 prephenate dehydrogenase [Halococcus salifodinae DSM 8989]
MKLLVVGAGTMGRWFAGTVAAKRTADTELAFADADPDAATAAADAIDGRTIPLDSDEHFDAVCLAVPISAVEERIAAHATQADRAIFDITGVMTDPVTAMAEHAPDRERVSFHPLFAPENSPGTVAVVADAPGPVTDEIRAALAAENDLFETTPDEHDEAMATVQARTHAAVLAYALAAEDVREEFHTPISGPLDTLADQILSGSPDVYSEIQTAFDGAEAVADAAARIANADDEEFERLYREARDAHAGGSDDEPSDDPAGGREGKR